MTLPFTPQEFFDVFAAYNRALWPFVALLWLSALAAVSMLVRVRTGFGRPLAFYLALLWGWGAVAYHVAFFVHINPAAWLFGGLFAIESAAFLWFGVIHSQLHFSPSGSIRHAAAWTLIAYALAYPFLVAAGGHAWPAAPTFGVPCPTTLLTVGLLFAADPPWPRTLALIPVLWSIVAGSAALLLGVTVDLMLWVASAALTVSLCTWSRSAGRSTRGVPVSQTN